jgi:glycosyltransferase involved in cell wall biosynthesis
MSAYWIWLGPIHDEATVLRRPAVSTAANRWQIGLLDGLRTIGADVEVVSYLPEPVWPKGDLVVYRATPACVPCETVGYLNGAGFRDTSLAWGHNRAVELIIKRRGARPAALLSYNIQPAYARVGLASQARGTPWVPVIADLPSKTSVLARHDAIAAAAAGRVFLAWAAFEESNSSTKLHLDGGVATASQCRTTPAQGCSILYSGTLSEYGGLDLLLAAFRNIQRNDAELWVCGKGRSANLEHAAREDARIKGFGLLSEARLTELSRRASVFVNPRPAGILASRYNFPSKLLEYLSYNKPVVSTWTPGLAPEYRDVVLVAPEEPVGLARELEKALTMSQQDRSALSLRIQRFLEAEKLWTVQAAKLRDWIRTEVATS